MFRFSRFLIFYFFALTVSAVNANFLINKPVNTLIKKVKVIKFSPSISLYVSDAIGVDRVDNITKLVNLYSKDKVLSVKSLFIVKRTFTEIKNGDVAIYNCLKMRDNCDLLKFTKLVDSIRNNKSMSIDPLHFHYAQKNPHVSQHFIYKKSGDAAENATDFMVMSSGKWEKLDGSYGINGFDGLYITRTRNGYVKDILITETKYAQSTLSKNLNCFQMSKNCVLETLNHLENNGKLDKFLIYQLREKILKDVYRAKLFKVTVSDEKVKIRSFDLKSQSGEMPEQTVDYGIYSKEIDLFDIKDDFDNGIASKLFGDG